MQSQKFSLLIAICASLLLIGPAFAKGEGKKLTKNFRKYIGSDQEGQALSTLNEIADLGGEEAIEALYNCGVKYAITSKTYDRSIQLLAEADGSLKYLSEELDKILKKSKKYANRVFIADFCSHIADQEDEAVNILGRLASEDSSSVVQKSAVIGLAKSKNKLAIEPLIDLFEKLSAKRRGALYNDVADALWNLTYQEFETIADWRKWWKSKQKTFDPADLDKKNKGNTGLKRKKRKGGADFWGVPIDAKNVIFVLDSSGSMRYVMKTDIPGLGRGDGSDGGGSSGGGKMTPEDIKLAEFWTRASMAKRELCYVVSKLEQDTIFNIVEFNSRTSKWKKKPQVATKKNKKKAIEWVKGLKIRQATATLDAIKESFSIDKNTKTIYFLSDGLPSKDGKKKDATSPILEWVFAQNRFRKIIIHTFGFDHISFPTKQPDPDLQKANIFLKDLAKKTGGKFTPIKVDIRRTPENPDPPEPKDDEEEKGKKDDEKKKSLKACLQTFGALQLRSFL